MTQSITEKESLFGDIINPKTNEPVKVGKSISFNDKAYDDINYLQERSNLFDDYNKSLDLTPTESGGVNYEALNNLPVVPVFLEKEYEEANKQNSLWLDSLNITTPEEVEEWKKKGKIGLFEAAQRAMTLKGLAKGISHLPFLNTAEVVRDVDALYSIDRLKSGKQISDAERDMLIDYLRELKEIQVRGMTLPNQFINGLIQAGSYMGEIAIGLAGTGVTFGASNALTAEALSKAAAKKAARKAVQKAINEAATESLMTGTKKTLSLSAAKGIYKDAQKSLLSSSTKAMSELGLKESAKIIAKETPKDIKRMTIGSPAMAYMTGKNIAGGYADRQLSGSFYITDAGEFAFANPEAPALSFFKSLGSTVFENYTETTGWMFAPVMSYFAKPVQKMLPQKFFTGFEKLIESRYGTKASMALKKYGYDGVIEEMGEEVLNRFLCQTFGINGLESYNLEGFMNNVFYADNPEAWLLEALTFATMSGGGHLAYGNYSKLKEHFEQQGNKKAVAELTKLANMSEPEKLEYFRQKRDEFRKNNTISIDEFMLEQGLIHIEGAQSVAEQMLRKKLAERGVDEDTIDDFVKNSTELDIRNKLGEIVVAEDGDAEKRREKAIKFASDKWLAQGIKDKNTSDMAAEITVDLLERISEAKGISIDELIESEIPDIETRSEEERYQDMTGYYEEYAERNGLMQEAQKLYQEMNELDKTGTEYNEPTININGVNRQTTNSEGRPIAKTKEAIEHFYNWFGDSKAVDEEGKPIVVYHGSVNTFEIFDKSKASPEGDMGAGFYFTSSEWDADDNYHGGGPDFENKVARLAEQLQAEDEELDYDEAKEQAEAQLMGEPHQFACYLKMENPCYIGENETRLLEDIYERVAEINEEDYEDYDEYEQARMEAEDEALNDIAYDIDAALGGFNISYDDAQAIKQAVFDGIYESGVSVEELRKKIQDLYIEDNEGNLVNNEVVRSVVEALGYDGIIDTTVADKFNMNIPYGTAHYIVFNPEQIKSVDNRGTFDSNNPNIYYQSAYHGTGQNFDEFSTEKVGTGEGAQAHGWGLYFAENKEVSESYRRQLSPKIEFTYDGKPIPKEDSIEYTELYQNPSAKYQRLSFWKGLKENFENGIKDIKEGKGEYANKTEGEKQAHLKIYKDSLKGAKRKIKLINDIDISKISFNGGQLFEVDVPESDVLLDEDKKFSEQPEKVQEAIKNLIEKEGLDFEKITTSRNSRTGAIEENKGRDIYRNIGQWYFEKRHYSGMAAGKFDYDSEKLNQWKNTSELLNKYGVKGITYDGRQDGRCYVVFDDKAIKVLKKYYQAAAMKRSEFNSFEDFYNDVIKNTTRKEKQQWNLQTKDGLTVRIPHDTILHDENKHQLTIGEWQKLFNNIDNVSKAAISKQASSYSGKSVLLKVNADNNTYGVVIELFKKNNPLISTAFIDDEKNVDNWIKNEAVPNGTKTTFSDISLTNIIKDIYPKFKPKTIKNAVKYGQDGNADKLKNIKGYYIPAERLIVLLKNADASTLPHEIAHFYLDLLIKHSDNEEIAADLAEVRKFVKNQGEPFTEEQHEKFARGFEAYIRSGYAKTNRLKKIFEDLKNLFLSIYDSIKNIVYKENGVNKTFTEDELKNIEDLFDRLLTTERERIKSTVFDKIEEIDNKIEEIKNHEAEEFKELDSIWRDNIALMDRKSDKKRKVKEYIELAEKMTSRDTKEVREWKKRYKDATLDILAAVSGKSRSWVANSRNWEKLLDIIGGAADEITTSGGFRAEWSEFYADTGVSYENDEIDGDYKLAEQAYSIMTEGSYDRVYGEDYRFAEIDNYIAKLDYLAAKVKTLKGTEKEAAFEAFCEVFGNMPEMPEEIAAEIAQKIPEMEEVYETQQRDDFNKKVYPSIPVVQQLQWYITNKLNELKVYNPETRYKMRLNRSHRLYRYIKNINSVDAAKKQIRRINEYVIDDMRNNQRSLLSKEIQKQIKVNSKVVKVGSLTKGKFDWKTNTVFAELVQLNKLSREEAEKQLGAMVNIDNAANSEARDSFDEADSGEFNKTGDFQAVLRNEFLQYRSQKLQDLDVTHTIQLLQDILELKEKGRKAKSEEDFLNKTQRWNTKNNLLDVLEETKLSGAQFGANWIAGVGRVAGLNGGVLANWESLLNAIFNRETAQKYSLLLDEARSEVYARRHMLHFYKKASDIYGFKSPSNWDKFIDFDYLQPIIDLMREYDNEKYTYTQKVFSINTPSGYAESSIEISRAQMITMFAWSLNDELEQRLFNQFGVQQIMDMFESKLSKEDKELAWALVDTCETMREDINEVFIRTTGLSLPKVQNYFPSKAERVQSDIDLYHDFFVKSSNPSFIKERKSCHRIPMKPMAPLEILIPHINKTAKYVILSEKTNFMNQVFKDTAIKTKMQEIWGSDNGAKIYQTLINKLAACTFTNYAKGTNLVASALDTVSRNYISSRIGFSGKVALGQLLSVVNYAENMPAAAWAKGFKETIKHPVESFKYMLENCEYLQSRLAGNTQNEIISILTSEKDRFRKLRNFMSTNTKWGDIIAITLGGKPYVDYLMEQGMTKEEAFDKFLEDTLRAQQAGTTSSISEWQSAQAQNCLTRMIFAFQNTTIQYERKFIDTLIQAKKGELSKSEAAKKLFIYKILNPIMFTSFLGNLSLLVLFRGLAGGDDDEPVGFLKSVIESIFLSGFGAYGFAGFFSSAVVESIIANLDSGYKHFDKAIPIYSDFNREIQKWVKGDLEFADYVEALAFVSDYGAGVAGTKVINAAGGLGNIAQGQFGVGLTRMAGWGEYTSTMAWTGEEPKRKKKKRK